MAAAAKVAAIEGRSPDSQNLGPFKSDADREEVGPGLVKIC
jgi:hypothetical protein